MQQATPILLDQLLLWRLPKLYHGWQLLRKRSAGGRPILPTRG